MDHLGKALLTTMHAFYTQDLMGSTCAAGQKPEPTKQTFSHLSKPHSTVTQIGYSMTSAPLSMQFPTDLEA